jgi:hypothetical protein
MRVGQWRSYGRLATQLIFHLQLTGKRVSLVAANRSPLRCSGIGDRSPIGLRTKNARTPIAAHEGVLAEGIEALCEHAPAPGALGSVVAPVSVVRVPHAG